MGVSKDGLSHWVPDPVENTLLVDQTVGGLLDKAVSDHADREAIVYSAYDDLGIAERWTYAELQRRAHRVAKALIASDVQYGDRVAIWAPSLPQWLELQFGAAYAGALVVPLNPLYRARDAAFVLGKSGSAMCFVASEHRGVRLGELLAELVGGLPDLKARVLLEPGQASPDSEWGRWLARGDGVSDKVLFERAAGVDPKQSAQIQFTSGTTGVPKGVELSHFGIVNNGRLFALRAGLIEGGRHVNPMPY